jgi:membrane protein implicated in regulation of membrane protease activity
MDTVYLISLVVGGLLLLASLAGDVFEMDALSGDIEIGDLHILTMRGATYFLFVFGVIGAALPRFAGTGSVTTAALAISAGVATAVIADRVFGYLRTSDSGELDGDSSLLGLLAEVVIPIRAHAEGKVTVRRGSERLELIARPFADSDGDPAMWKHVRIIDVREGTALVSPAQSDT